MNEPRKLSATLTAEDAGEIKSLLWRGYTQTEVAKRYGVTQPTISRITHGHQYYFTTWPNGAIGSIDRTHYRQVMAHRKVEQQARSPAAAQPSILSEALKDKLGGGRPPINEHLEMAATSDVEPEGTEDVPTADDVEVVDQDEADARHAAQADALDSLGKAAEQEMLDDIVSTMSNPGEQTKAKRKRAKRIRYTVMPWDDVLEKAGNVSMVQAASDNEVMQKAIGVVFLKLPEAQWGEKIAISLVSDVAAMMRKEE